MARPERGPDDYPRVLPVGDRALTVELGDSLEEETVGRVRSLDRRLAEAALAGIVEAVPTYASLLVVYDRERTSFAELSDRLLGFARDLGGGAAPGRLVEIPALYDGADLDEVAATAGLGREDVAAIHSGREYSVLMLGFSPGFAYMGFADERIRRPRRATPRVRVPSGAIAVAGAQTGIYPRSLPGGWNLLGRTSARLFDPAAARPSVLMPGDRVRFRPVSSLDPEMPNPERPFAGRGVEVIAPGFLTTVQDGGRVGLRRVAVPRCGFADPAAARTANACVGNAPRSPAIEICGAGLSLRFEEPTYVALGGAAVRAHLERADLASGRMDLPMNVAVRVRPGNVLTVSALDGGMRAYVAIAGLDAPRLLGSASADPGSGLLRALQAGDRLAVTAPRSEPPSAGRHQPGAPQETRVRVILGPQADHFEEAAIQAFLGALWQVGTDSDRVGARLDGPRIPHAGPAEILSDGMVPGCIQVPPDGRPIVMLADCPTTGGYPKIGCVASEDLRVVAQAIPRRTALRFVAVGIGEV